MTTGEGKILNGTVHGPGGLCNYRAAICVSAIFAVARRPSVCLPVRLSVTLVYCIQTAEDIVKLLLRHGSPIILVLLSPGADTKHQGEPLLRGCKVHEGGEKLPFSTEITVYFGKRTR